MLNNDSSVYSGSTNPTESLATSQWLLLDALEKEYRHKLVYGGRSKFNDAVWYVGKARINQKRIIWNSLLKGYNYTLSLLIKVVVYDQISLGKLEASSALFKIHILKNTFLDLIQHKNLLNGNRDEVLLGLNHISDIDLLSMLDYRLVSTTSQSYFQQECSEILAFISFINHHAKALPFLEVRAQFPWKNLNQSIDTWSLSRANDLEHTFPDEGGFFPLSTECVMPLVEKSLCLVYEHDQDLIKLTRLIREYHWSKVYTGPSSKEILAKFGAPFSWVLTPPDLTKLRSEQTRLSSVYVWIRKILYVARGACLNLILLTSGLRNSDIRALKVGCCKPSNRVDMMFYIHAHIQKTKNFIPIPVPAQTEKAINLLALLKLSESDYLIDAVKFTNDTFDSSICEDDVRLANSGSLNTLLRNFATHFGIPFIDPYSGKQYSAHNYRTTVAGWLDAHSNLSLLMVRRLFGHSNDVMPTAYLRKNPSFIQERKDQKAKAAKQTSIQMALAASQGRLAGAKGEDLIRGYQSHVSRCMQNPQKSHSLTDTELITSFSELLEQRLLNGSLYGFLTPFGVRCMRNPADSTQAPCARRSHLNKAREIGEEILKYINDLDPQNCIGSTCDQAMVGPWSESILESLIWHAELLNHKYGNTFTDDHFRLHAINFIRQYGPPIKKVFNIEVESDGTINHAPTRN